MAEVITRLASAEPKVTRDECAVIVARWGVARVYGTDGRRKSFGFSDFLYRGGGVGGDHGAFGVR